MNDINVTKIKEYLANIAFKRNELIMNDSLSDDDKKAKLDLLNIENDELFQTFDLYKLLLDDVSDVTFENIKNSVSDYLSSLSFPPVSGFRFFDRGSSLYVSSSATSLIDIKFTVKDKVMVSYRLNFVSYPSHKYSSILFGYYHLSDRIVQEVYSSSSFPYAMYIDSDGFSHLIIDTGSPLSHCPIFLSDILFHYHYSKTKVDSLEIIIPSFSSFDDCPYTLYKKYNV